MAWLEILGNDIYYGEAGSGQPLVFLHGMSSCGEAWCTDGAVMRTTAANVRALSAHPLDGDASRIPAQPAPVQQ